MGQDTSLSATTGSPNTSSRRGPSQRVSKRNWTRPKVASEMPLKKWPPSHSPLTGLGASTESSTVTRPSAQRISSWCIAKARALDSGGGGLLARGGLRLFCRPQARGAGAGGGQPVGSDRRTGRGRGRALRGGEGRDG